MAITYWRDVSINDTDDVIAVWRFDDDKGFYERWDRVEAMWIRDPEGIETTGIGGHTSFEVASKRSVDRVIGKWERQRRRTR
jgi:hypothetical protein